MSSESYSYDAVASIYDEAARLYSLGAIDRSKEHHLAGLVQHERVLYVGVGRGRDALAAARMGARVTALDVSPRMLERLALERDREGLTIELVEAAASSYEPAEPYDVVVAHYFLNLFAEAAAREALRRMLDWLKPDGRFVVADFAPASRGPLSRVMTAAYYRPLNLIAWALGFCALHAIPDHPGILAREGLVVTDETRFPVFRRGEPAFWTVAARKPLAGEVERGPGVSPSAAARSFT